MWNPDSQVYVNTGLPPSTSPSSRPDQFDQFLHLSHHIVSPNQTPELILEIPSDTESGPIQSTEYLPTTDTYSTTPSPAQLPRRCHSRSPRASVKHKGRQGRRASHAADFLGGSLTNQAVEDTSFLFPRRSRLQSLGDIDIQEESYTVRSFALEGHRVVNKGDFVASRSRNNSMAE